MRFDVSLSLFPSPATPPPVFPRWAVLSTYPPTPCGLATFSQALVTSLSGLGADVDVVRVLDDVQAETVPEVSHHLVNATPGTARATASALNGYDVVVVQHEFGIYGGADGEDVLAVLVRLRVPVITVLHTVLADPTPHQHQVLQSVVSASDVLVTMTRTARDRLVEGYDVDPDVVHLIPHGAADALVTGSRLRAVDAAAGSGVDGAHGTGERRPRILTWGLIGPGKGIEWGIDAVAGLGDLTPAPVYVVAGQTHPRVLERDGESYRRGLESRARDLGVSDDVVFVDHYLSAAHLHRLVRGADVVLLPYDSREQVTSGVLIEAVAAGKPVVSTRFPHAVELLDGGAGLLVDQGDPAAIAAALRQVLTEPGLASRMSNEAEALAPDLSWRAVAGRYLDLATALHGEGFAVPDDASVANPVAVVA